MDVYTSCFDEEIKEQEKLIEEAEEEVTYVNYEITSYPAFYTLENYVKYFDKEDKTFSVPDFQRKPVWDDTRKSKLIDSFLRGLPVPSVFLFTNDGAHFTIVDGLQRINTIYSYVMNAFKLKKLGEDCPYNNKFFKDLSENDRKRLMNVVMQATVIRPVAQKDNEIVYKIFERLNTGGMSLNNMEIRRSIAYGVFLETLEKVNSNPNWQRILGVKGLGKRFLDLELVLRCFAFYEKEYTGVMKSYLNEYMEQNKDLAKEDVALRFVNAVRQISEKLHEKPFAINTRSMPNYTVLDSVIVALMRNGEVANLADKFSMLLNDNNYKDIIERGNGTTTKKLVDERLSLASSYLQ